MIVVRKFSTIIIQQSTIRGQISIIRDGKFDELGKMMKIERGSSIAQDRSDLYGMVSSIYIQVPDKKTLDLNLVDPVLRLLGAVPKETKEASRSLADGVQMISDSISERGRHFEEGVLDLAKDWTRLFRGVDKNGPPPPYESVYLDGRMQTKSSREVHHLFSRSGIRIPEEWHQPADYIGVELDFMRLLCEREGHHCKEDQLKVLQEVLEEERAFLENHLCVWVPVFCKRMLKEAREKYFCGIAYLTLGLLQFDQIWVPRLLSQF